MTSPFDLLAGQATAMLNQCFAELVTLARGASSTPAVSASWVSQSEEIQTVDAKATGYVDRYWFVSKTDYVIAGNAVEPKTGDRLTDENSVAWEVLPSRATPSVISYAHGAEWKIATKRVS